MCGLLKWTMEMILVLGNATCDEYDSKQNCTYQYPRTVNTQVTDRLQIPLWHNLQKLHTASQTLVKSLLFMPQNKITSTWLPIPFANSTPVYWSLVEVTVNLKRSFRPRSHRTHKQICTQIWVQTLWCCLQPVWTLPLTTVCSIFCVRLLQGAPHPVWTGPKFCPHPLQLQHPAWDSDSDYLGA